MRALLAVVALLAALPGTAHAGEWLAGDLHVHSTYSHDSYGGAADDNTGPEEAHTLGHAVGTQFTIAAARGLDYLALTDHNDVRSQTDPGFGAGGVIGVPGYEASLRGHGQMLGATRVADPGDASAASVAAIADALRAEGGVLQANHPADPVWAYGYDVPVDAVEVWNLPWPYQPPLPSATDNEQALRYWEGWLDRGARVAATGGSDSHWVSTTAAQGPGQPTTWVYAEERSARGVLDAIRAGRTFVSHQPPALGGPRLLLEADRDGDGHFEAMAGDTVAPGTAMRARVLGAPGALLRVVTDGGRPAFAPVLVSGPAFAHRFRAPAGSTWVRAEVYGQDLAAERTAGCAAIFGADLGEQTTYCTGRIAMLALASPLYVR